MTNSVCKPQVYESLYNKHAKDLRNYLYYKFGNLESAEDIVQESFIKLWQKCADVVLEKAKSFLYTVATNMFLNEKSHDKVVLKFQQIPQNDTNIESPEFLMLEKEYLVKLQKTLAQLPDGQREVFLLNRIDKKTYAEIAELLNISVKAVEKRMHNALKQLREKIGAI
ncbi:MAG: RNA polymerase subunit sigma-70 [Flavobacteriales bacterium CG03_land_8_20_14_0_80_35_15]|nr:RNA polymerase sigma factor [Zetaproteobacteria bacterium]PIV18715.1 MAG: RNA polymerase subunit sigma-70 [Flavobacteriales bacterium CG03_land_8_20_14_0_80_35_15]PIX07210.1 MAG: RNA polymerase subunit sigma-70 [Flavobacteriales bacterium CG_4_8_14_3_um_filter_35_10]PJA05826.1 MAG: RNA polymerase subunit sigma-70 [Flavobacteriales bacterium CG_4_10_14_0_2_um_filter_35_18]